MKRRICTLLVLVLVLCGGIACAQRAVPDFCAFSQGLVHERTDKKHEDTKDSLRRYYEGTSDNIELAVQEYIQLLQDEYGFWLSNKITLSQWDGFDYIIFGLQSKLPEDDAIHFSVRSSAQGWEIDNCDVFVQYWKYLGGDRQGVTCYINNEYVFEALGDYSQLALAKPGNATKAPNATATSAPRATAAPTTAVNSQPCSSCDGDGKITHSCTSCGGDGKTEHRCTFCSGKGEKKCTSCSGRGKKDCVSCSSGKVRCSSCGGSGKRTNKSRCTICGGDGKKNCSSCSGMGSRRCSSCSGSGSRRCSNCGGNGKREIDCSSCGGYGRHESDCSACGGDGRI